MAPNVPSASAITRAESIALLHLLHAVPTRPSSNPTDSLPIRPKGYTLPFERERNLAGTLAYLSSTKDDPDHIPAVCVEEIPKSASLSVLLAVNKVKRGDGNQVLQGLKQGFERIFTALSRLDGEWYIPLSLLLLISPRRRWYSKHRE
jgi:hypothetical protein